MRPTTRTGFRLDDGQIEVVDQILWPILRQLTPAEKVAQINGSHRTAKALLECGTRMRHPDWTAEQVAAEVSRRLLHGTS